MSRGCHNACETHRHAVALVSIVAVGQRREGDCGIYLDLAHWGLQIRGLTPTEVHSCATLRCGHRGMSRRASPIPSARRTVRPTERRAGTPLSFPAGRLFMLHRVEGVMTCRVRRCQRKFAAGPNPAMTPAKRPRVLDSERGSELRVQSRLPRAREKFRAAPADKYPGRNGGQS